ncbi:MAG: sugar porter family MFS transporter [Candidatus Obscuribacterales bacterium]|nr:sugar porter family MFS transporter [Candidatus Obscuribacterales bacterium]
MDLKPYLFLFKSSLVGALGGLLFGFDTAVIAGTTQALTAQYQLTAEALGLTVSTALWGTVVSSMFSGIPGDKLGARDTLRIAALMYIISALGCALAWDLPSLLVFRFIGGLGIGCSSVLGPVYIAEIAPANWRGRLVGLFQINVVLGILLAYFSNFVIGTFELGSAEWRWKLGVSGIPAFLFFLMLFSIPRSPRWLVARGRIDEAREVLKSTGVEDYEEELEEITHNIKEEHSQKKEVLFCRKYRLPIFLAIAIGMFNQLSGINAILYYLNDIFSLAGFDKLSSNQQAVAIGSTNLAFCLLAMSMIDKIGRRKLLLIGSVGCGICMAGVALIFFTREALGLLLWFLVAYIGFFSFSQGAVIWVYISEIFPTPVRAKGQSLGSFTHWIMNALISFIYPIIAKSCGAFPFAFFSLMMFVQLFVVWKFFPETKGITLEEMETRLKLNES